MMNLLKNYNSFGSARVKIFYTEKDFHFAKNGFEPLIKTIPSILSRFNISGSFPVVHAIIVPDRNEFDRLVHDLLHIKIEVPSHPARIAQAQKMDMVLLSPDVYETQSTFNYDPQNFQRLTIHEFVHMVEEFLSPNIEESPRWWGEGLAVYFSDQWKFEAGFNQAVLDGIASRNIPTINQIIQNPKLAYDWGWTIVKSILDKHGMQMIIQIMNQCADGDVLSFLPINHLSLKKHFREFITTL